MDCFKHEVKGVFSRSYTEFSLKTPYYSVKNYSVLDKYNLRAFFI